MVYQQSEKSTRIHELFRWRSFEIQVASQLRAYANEFEIKSSCCISFCWSTWGTMRLALQECRCRPEWHYAWTEVKTRKRERAIGIETLQKGSRWHGENRRSWTHTVKLQVLNSAFETAEVILRSTILCGKINGRKESWRAKNRRRNRKIEQEMIPKVMETTAEDTNSRGKRICRKPWTRFSKSFFSTLHC